MGILKYIQNIWTTLRWYFKSRNLIAVTDFWIHPGPDRSRHHDAEMIWKGIAPANRSPFKILKGQSLWSASGLEFWWLAGLLGTHQVRAAISSGWLVSRSDFKKGARYVPKSSGQKALFNRDSPEAQARQADLGFQGHSPREDKVHYPFPANLSDADRMLLWPMWGWDLRVMRATWGDNLPEEVERNTLGSEDLEQRVEALITAVREDLAGFKRKESETGWKDLVSVEFADVWW